MFESIGWGEILVIAFAALFIFGPERLPSVARDAAAALKRVRREISAVRGQLDESLGDEMADLRNLDLGRYHPKTFLREQLLGDGPDTDPSRAGSSQPPSPSDRDVIDPGPDHARPGSRTDVCTGYQ